jgi:CPA2 family monovalent cation:H+ antiporter-2
VVAARAIIFTIPDPSETRRAVQLARLLNPGAAIIARTRFAAEMPALIELGATHVVPEELETAGALIGRILNHYLVPRTDIDEVLDRIRIWPARPTN